MALTMNLTGNAEVGVEASCAGISDPTSASAEKSYGTVIRAKDSTGKIVAALLGRETYSLSVSGYSTNGDGPDLSDSIEVGGLSGKVTSVTIEKSVEDFSRFTAEGRGLP